MSTKPCVAFTIAALALGSASTAVAQSGGSRSKAPNIAIVTPAPNYSAFGPTERLRRAAPIGHRQPRPVDLPNYTELPPFETVQRRLDSELDKKLIICRGC
jgi:hypothetical protein